MAKPSMIVPLSGKEIGETTILISKAENQPEKITWGQFIGCVIGACGGSAVTLMTFKPVYVTDLNDTTLTELFNNTFLPLVAPGFMAAIGIPIGNGIQRIYRSLNKGDVIAINNQSLLPEKGSTNAVIAENRPLISTV